MSALEVAQAKIDKTLQRLPRTLNFAALASRAAPPRHWFRDGWVGSGVTLLPGTGGTGKSALEQHEATAAGLGRAYFAPACDPYKTLVWNCEDEHDDMWRRQEAICEHEQVGMADLAGRLVLVSRYGCENALMAELQRTLVVTRLFEELRQQVNDEHIDVLTLDNAAHVFLGNHDDRTQVTQFVNELNGLVRGRPFGIIVCAHLSRAIGSEFTGSVAWENAARMRWYLGSRLPDQRPEDGDEAATDTRFLCRRKSNYSALDHVRMTMRRGLLIPDDAPLSHIGGLVHAMDEKRADETCVAGFRSLCGMGVRTTDGKTSPDYLPSQIVAKRLACGFSKSDLGNAMHRLMTRGVFTRAVIGKNANRSDRWGLVLKEG